MAKQVSRASSKSTSTARKKSPTARSGRFSRMRASTPSASLGPCGLAYAIEIEETADANFYGVIVPDILGCTTTGRSIEHAIRNAREAIALHLKYLAEDGLPIPRRRRPVD